MNGRLRKLRILSFYYVGISITGLCLLAVLTFGLPSSSQRLDPSKQLSVTIFSAICVLGMMAGLYPSICCRTSHFHGNNPKQKQEVPIPFKGHHPTCKEFSAHTLQFRNKKLCAGCTGLVIGAFISLLGSAVYFFVDLQISDWGTLFFLLGSIGVVIGLLQHNLFAGSSSVHFLLNVIYVSGAFWLLVAVQEKAGNVFLDLFLLALIVFWIIARVVLSQLEHNRICVICNTEKCKFLL